MMKIPTANRIIEHASALRKHLWTRKTKIRGAALCFAAVISGTVLWWEGDRLELWDAQVVDRLAMLQDDGQVLAASGNSEVLAVDSIFYFDRAHHAQVIQNLADMKVAAQVTDFIFETKVDDLGDGALIAATQRAGNVYFGMSFGMLSRSPEADAIQLDAGLLRFLKTTDWPVRLNGDPAVMYAGHDPKITYPELASNSSGIGFINVRPDPDGVVRRVPLLLRYGQTFYPSLSFRVVCDMLGVSPEDVIVKPGVSITLSGTDAHGSNARSEIVIPIDRYGNMLLNFSAVVPQTKKYSYREIIQASRNSPTIDTLGAELSGKIVILSETVEKPYRLRSRPRDAPAPLVVIHKAVIDNIISGSFLRPMPVSATWSIAAALVLILLALSLQYASLVIATGAILMSGLYSVTGVFFLHNANLVFEFLQPVMVLFITLSALMAGLGVERAMISAETDRARRKAEHELEIGREIQAGFFPNRLPQVSGWEVKVHFKAARHVAGDFYDIFRLGRQGMIGIVTADVCDKGVGAALFMALFRSFLRLLSGRAVRENYLENQEEPSDTLLNAFHAINNYISINHEQAAMFATVFYGILDPDTGDLLYINGGHEPPAVIAHGKIKCLLNPTGPAVGLQPDAGYTVGHVAMDPEDTLVVYTDGVIDALNKASRPFTKRRLQSMFELPVASAGELIERIRQEVEDHSDGIEQYDDITVTVVRRDSVSQGVPET